MSDFWGIWGNPYVDLTPFVDPAALAAIDDEITLGLVDVAPAPTGGSLKWMGVTAPSATADPYVDYMQVIEQLSEDELREFVALADDPGRFRDRELEALRFGDETEHPLNLAQARFLTYRHRVYFPWEVSFHFLDTSLWDCNTCIVVKAWSA